MSRWVNANEVYWLPASVWWTRPARSLTPSRRRPRSPSRGCRGPVRWSLMVAARQPDDPAGEDVEDEGDVDGAGPGRDVGEVGDPQLVRGRLAVKSRSTRSLGRGSLAGRDRGPDSLARSAPRPSPAAPSVVPRCTGPRRALAAQVQPHLAGTEPGTELAARRAAAISSTISASRSARFDGPRFRAS